MVKFRFDFQSLIPNNRLTRFLGIAGGNDTAAAAAGAVNQSPLRAQSEAIAGEIARLEGRLEGFYATGEGRREDESQLAALQKEATRLKAELEAQRAGGTVVNAPSNSSTNSTTNTTVNAVPMNDPNNYPAEAF